MPSSWTCNACALMRDKPRLASAHQHRCVLWVCGRVQQWEIGDVQEGRA